MRSLPLVLLLPTACLGAFQLPFSIPDFLKSAVPATETSNAGSPLPRVAIIGAGAGGSSAAFWISKAKERFGLQVEIDVYEQSDYIGGRSTVVYPYDDKSLPPLELGASIFVQANKNLWRASDEFNLKRDDFSGEDDDIGIWDGENLLFTYNGGWWDMAKLIWRYGFFSPRRTDNAVKGMISQYLTLYTPSTPIWNNISQLRDDFKWQSLTGSKTSEYLRGQGVSDPFIFEFVEAATRVNYGQNVDAIHALEGACSMAATGAAGIVGGNFQMFEKFLEHSGAHVYLNTKVTGIVPASNPASEWTVHTSKGSSDYQAVIIAAPIHQTGIALPADIVTQVPAQPYVHLHVTLLSTSSPTANTSYFGLGDNNQVPHMLLTTYQGVRQGGVEPEFNSLSYHGKIRENEWAVKIFSKQRMEDKWLQSMFNNNVGWIYRKEWQAYPVLPPTQKFPPVKLDRGLYYVNAFEPFISTMETETIASRNVVDLLLHDEFNSGICGDTLRNASEVSADYVYGWDC
ncbi:hypothetical protein AX16_002578 [Volvariella volvacea WC 439]|nr:hypothetical protein AX16_002578 [Volvariella volvacea WC 439]